MSGQFLLPPLIHEKKSLSFSERGLAFPSKKSLERSDMRSSRWIIDIMVAFQVAVAVITKAGMSELSDFLYNKTSRDRPGGPPTSIQVLSGGANSVKILWDEPVKPNGPIDEYQIKYGYLDHRSDYIEKMTNSSKKHAVLEDLAFNANYDIKVRACTRFVDSLDPICGDWSAKRHLTGYGRKCLKSTDCCLLLEMSGNTSFCLLFQLLVKCLPRW